MSRDEVPHAVWDEAVCREDSEGSTKVTYHRMNRIWGHIVDMKLAGMDSARFARLAEVAKLVLTIPHSNAGEERVFFCHSQNRCDDRAKLQLERTLSCLVTVKLSLPESKAQPCYTFQPSKVFLQVCSSCASSC